MADKCCIKCEKKTNLNEMTSNKNGRNERKYKFENMDIYRNTNNSFENGYAKDT